MKPIQKILSGLCSSLLLSLGCERAANRWAGFSAPFGDAGRSDDAGTPVLSCLPPSTFAES